MAFPKQSFIGREEQYKRWTKYSNYEKVEILCSQFSYELKFISSNDAAIKEMLTAFIDNGQIKHKMTSGQKETIEQKWLKLLGQYVTEQDPIKFEIAYEVVRWEYINIARLLFNGTLKALVQLKPTNLAANQRLAKVKRKIAALEEVIAMKKAFNDVMDIKDFHDNQDVKDNWTAVKRLIYCRINIKFDDAYKGQLDDERITQPIYQLLLEYIRTYTAKLQSLKQNMKQKNNVKTMMHMMRL